MAKEYAIEVVNWDEHQERADRANYTWFKFHSNAVDKSLWLKLSNDEFRVWMYILCKRNAQSERVVHFDDGIIAAHCKLKGASGVEKIISKLKELGAIKISETGFARDNAGITPADSRRTPDGIRVEKSRGEEIRGAAGASPRDPPPESLDPEAAKAKAWAKETDLEEAALYFGDQFQKRKKTSMPPPLPPGEIAALERVYELVAADGKGKALQRTKALISTFIWLDDDWYDKQGRTPSTLEKNFVRIFGLAAKASSMNRAQEASA